jgi:hypothetical protein
MANGKYILVDEDLQLQILKKLEAIEELLLTGHSIKQPDGDVRMDTADLARELGMDRRTLYTYREKHDMPYERKANGRIFYWKSKIDAYFGKNK